MKHIRIFRHEDWIKAGHLTDTLDRRGVPYEPIAIDEGVPVPDEVDDVSGLAFLGGTTSVNDPFPWIDDELRLIRRAAERHLPVLGHCFGITMPSPCPMARRRCTAVNSAPIRPLSSTI